MEIRHEVIREAGLNMYFSVELSRNDRQGYCPGNPELIAEFVQYWDAKKFYDELTKDDAGCTENDLIGYKLVKQLIAVAATYTERVEIIDAEYRHILEDEV